MPTQKSSNSPKNISDPAANNANQASVAGTLARLFWILIGNFILIFVAIAMFQNKTISTKMSVAYWATVIMMALVRFIDIRMLGGLTIDGTVATMADWQKYTLRLIVITAVIYAATTFVPKLV